MRTADEKIVDLEALAATRAQLGERGKTVVHCHGCFDVVHPGHIRYLKFAKDLGDVLVVSISADEVVGKGPDRPYITESLRAENVAALECVDYVCIDRNESAVPILERLRPDIYVKGKEYETSSDRRFTRERGVVESYGGRVVFSSGDVIYSSTYILGQFSDRFRIKQERLVAFCRAHGIDAPGIAALQHDWTRRKVLVVGDPILDHYVHCDLVGVASENPILSVTPIHEDWYVGASGLIAAQLAELGASATLLTCLGDDAAAYRYRESLRHAGVELVDLRDDDRPVAIKTRYLVDERKVFKVDTMRHRPISARAGEAIAGAIAELLPAHDALIATDFGFGLFGQAVCEAVSAIPKRLAKPYYLDVSHTRQANILRFSGPRLATPTEHELRFAFADNEAGLSNLAARFFDETGAELLMLTMGKRGVLLFHRPAHKGDRLRTEFLPAFEDNALDPVGAGDVYLVGAALSDLAGASAAAAAYVGSALAALHVASLGNAVVKNAAFHQYLGGRGELRG
jgi:rfaE bifunctional protein kinase chain/domain/rfaE bifunctional protein nucleotidyltransferase chain/domain